MDLKKTKKYGEREAEAETDTKAEEATQRERCCSDIIAWDDT